MSTENNDFDVIYERVLDDIRQTLIDQTTYKNEEVYIVIGNSDAGKSTTLCYLLGVTPQRTEWEGAITYAVSNPAACPIIGHEPISKTFSVKGWKRKGETTQTTTKTSTANRAAPLASDTLVRTKETQIVYLDTPGFMERRKEKRLAASINIELAIKRAKKINGMIFILSKKDIDASNGLPIVEFIKRVVGFMDLNRYDRNPLPKLPMLFVITKTEPCEFQTLEIEKLAKCTLTRLHNIYTTYMDHEHGEIIDVMRKMGRTKTPLDFISFDKSINDIRNVFFINLDEKTPSINQIETRLVSFDKNQVNCFPKNIFCFGDINEERREFERNICKMAEVGTNTIELLVTSCNKIRESECLKLNVEELSVKKLASKKLNQNHRQENKTILDVYLSFLLKNWKWQLDKPHDLEDAKEREELEQLIKIRKVTVKNIQPILTGTQQKLGIIDANIRSVIESINQTRLKMDTLRNDSSEPIWYTPPECEFSKVQAGSNKWINTCKIEIKFYCGEAGQIHAVREIIGRADEDVEERDSTIVDGNLPNKSIFGSEGPKDYGAGFYKINLNPQEGQYSTIYYTGYDWESFWSKSTAGSDSIQLCSEPDIVRGVRIPNCKPVARVQIKIMPKYLPSNMLETKKLCRDLLNLFKQKHDLEQKFLELRKKEAYLSVIEILFKKVESIVVDIKSQEIELVKITEKFNAFRKNLRVITEIKCPAQSDDCNIDANIKNPCEADDCKGAFTKLIDLFRFSHDKQAGKTICQEKLAISSDELKLSTENICELFIGQRGDCVDEATKMSLVLSPHIKSFPSHSTEKLEPVDCDFCVSDEPEKNFMCRNFGMGCQEDRSEKVVENKLKELIDKKNPLLILNLSDIVITDKIAKNIQAFFKNRPKQSLRSMNLRKTQLTPTTFGLILQTLKENLSLYELDLSENVYFTQDPVDSEVLSQLKQLFCEIPLRRLIIKDVNFSAPIWNEVNELITKNLSIETLSLGGVGGGENEKHQIQSIFKKDRNIPLFITWNDHVLVPNSASLSVELPYYFNMLTNFYNIIRSLTLDSAQYFTDFFSFKLSENHANTPSLHQAQDKQSGFYDCELDECSNRYDTLEHQVMEAPLVEKKTLIRIEQIESKNLLGNFFQYPCRFANWCLDQFVKAAINVAHEAVQAGGSGYGKQKSIYETCFGVTIFNSTHAHISELAEPCHQLTLPGK